MSTYSGTFVILTGRGPRETCACERCRSASSNPTHSAGDPDAILRFADAIARILAVTSHG